MGASASALRRPGVDVEPGPRRVGLRRELAQNGVRGSVALRVVLIRQNAVADVRVAAADQNQVFDFSLRVGSGVAFDRGTEDEPRAEFLERRRGGEQFHVRGGLHQVIGVPRVDNSAVGKVGDRDSPESLASLAAAENRFHAPREQRRMRRRPLLGGEGKSGVTENDSQEGAKQLATGTREKVHSRSAINKVCCRGTLSSRATGRRLWQSKSE